MVSRHGGNRGTPFSDLTTQRFTGQYHEQALPGGEGLAYYNARWYDPALGRFVSPDSIVPSPSNPQDFNRYSYVRNNPLGYVDPSGHDPWWLQEPWHNTTPEEAGSVPSYAHNVLQQNRVARYYNYGRQPTQQRPKLKPKLSTEILKAGYQTLTRKEDMVIIGVNASMLYYGAYHGPTLGIEGSVLSDDDDDPLKGRFLDLRSAPRNVPTLDDLGLYFYDGQAQGTGGGVSISPYLGNVWNVNDYADYLGPFKAVNVTFAVGYGGSLPYFGLRQVIRKFHLILSCHLDLQLDLQLVSRPVTALQQLYTNLSILYLHHLLIETN